jgi:hypothetical protein
MKFTRFHSKQNLWIRYNNSMTEIGMPMFLLRWIYRIAMEKLNWLPVLRHRQTKDYAGFEVVIVVTMKCTILLEVTPYSPADHNIYENPVYRRRLSGFWWTMCNFFRFWVRVYRNTEMVRDNRSHQNANVFSPAPKMRRSTWVDITTKPSRSRECLQELKYVYFAGGESSWKIRSLWSL